MQKNKFLLIIGDSRQMPEIKDESIGLIVTSPPYWHIKDYGNNKQIGYKSDLHTYLKDLYLVWKETFRVLKEGRRLVINIGDQFLRTKEYGLHKVVPIHAEIIIQCEQIGFDYMGSIIWQKISNTRTTGGASIMGSYPYPPNGMVTYDYEYILIFKKPSKKREKIDKKIKDLSKMSKEEWKEYFRGHWNIPGVRQKEHIAMFPEEIPRRLIKMYSFVGDTVLDPFMGSGTTAKVSLELNRNVIGIELNENYKDVIEKKVFGGMFSSDVDYQVIIREQKEEIIYLEEYTPRIKNIDPPKGIKK